MLFSKDIAVPEITHLIVMSKFSALKGSFNFNEWYRPTLNFCPLLNSLLDLLTNTSD